jgi:hypothetical protein
MSGWLRSSFCEHGQCVAVALGEGLVHIRDGKDPTGPVLTFDLDEWRAFCAGIRAGEFDFD